MATLVHIDPQRYEEKQRTAEPTALLEAAGKAET